MNPTFQRVLGATLGALAASVTDGPWRSKSVLAALAILIIGMLLWTQGALKPNPARPPDSQAVESTGSTPDAAAGGFHRPIPWHARYCASYIGGYCIGWAFRRFVKLAAVVLVLAVSLLGLVKITGCDTTALRARMEHTAAAAQEQAGRERDYARGLLPSAAAGGIGVFFGFRRRLRESPGTPPVDPPA